MLFIETHGYKLNEKLAYTDNKIVLKLYVNGNM